ncbi:MAG: hypothetical protein PHR51_02460 [Patescibacteria group bacterium]|nr:hypothetical protein [Patescibacteria group bacterium]
MYLKRLAVTLVVVCLGLMTGSAATAKASTQWGTEPYFVGEGLPTITPDTLKLQGENECLHWVVDGEDAEYTLDQFYSAEAGLELDSSVLPADASIGCVGGKIIFLDLKLEETFPETFVLVQRYLEKQYVDLGQAQVVSEIDGLYTKVWAALDLNSSQHRGVSVVWACQSDESTILEVTFFGHDLVRIFGGG